MRVRLNDLSRASSQALMEKHVELMARAQKHITRGTLKSYERAAKLIADDAMIRAELLARYPA